MVRASSISARLTLSLSRPLWNRPTLPIMVLSPDDITTSRKLKSLAPRDNVIFELGLFMGSLGRERCYMVRQDNSQLKIPSDLLGIKVGQFCCPSR